MTTENKIGLVSEGRLYTATYLMKQFLDGTTRGKETDLCLFLRAITKSTKKPKDRLHFSMLKQKLSEFKIRKQVQDLPQ